MWGRFEERKEALARQYEEDRYEDGLTLDAQKALLEQTHEKYKNEPMLVRKTHLFCELLKNARIEVRGDELFPDKIEHGNLMDEYVLKYHLGVYDEVERLHGIKMNHPKGGVMGALDFGHLTPDWERLFALGFPGVLAELRAAKEKDGGAHEDYYKYGIMTYEAVIDFLLRFASLAEKKGTPASLFAAENLRALAAHEPRTTAQGMHLLFLYYHLQMHFDVARVRSLGPVDLLLGPLYERDLAEGRFTEAQLREMTRYFLWQISAKHVTARALRFGQGDPLHLLGLLKLCQGGGDLRANRFRKTPFPPWGAIRAARQPCFPPSRAWTAEGSPTGASQTSCSTSPEEYRKDPPLRLERAFPRPFEGRAE